MSSIALDHPGDLSWFPGYPEAERRRIPSGDCPHPCQHRILKVVAWGPDMAHYELSVCQDYGCQGNCRAWHGPSTYERLMTMDWKLLAPPGAHP